MLGAELGTIHGKASWQLSHMMSTHVHTHTQGHTARSGPPEAPKGSTHPRAFMSRRMRSQDKEGIHMAPPQQTAGVASRQCPLKLPSRPLAPAHHTVAPRPFGRVAPAKTLLPPFPHL